MNYAEETKDRRVNRTRRAIFDAFAEHVLKRRYDEIKVADVIETANVGRSTFYEHFKSKDDVLLSSIEPLFAVLADAATGRPERKQLMFVLSHFWEQRALARIIFASDLYFKMVRKLSGMVQARLHEDDEDAPLIAWDRAARLLGLLRAWLGAEFAAGPEKLADYIIAMAGDASLRP